MRRARGGGKGYEKISRELLQRKTLSLKARGLIGLLLSLSDDWDCNGVEGIVRQFCDLDGVASVNAGIKELETAGMFARMKRQGASGHWEWLWTYSDDPSEVMFDVLEWESKGYHTSNAFKGNRKAQPPKRDAETPGQTVLVNSEHGASTVLAKPVNGQTVDGQPQNKESLFPPSEEETQTGETTTREPAPAQAAEADLFSEPSSRVDPLVADISAAKRKTVRKRRTASALNDTARSQQAERIAAAYQATLLRKLPHAEYVALAVGIDECLKLGWPESDIVDVGLPHWNASRKGAALFARIAAEAVSRNSSAAPSKPATTTVRFHEQAKDHAEWFNPDGSFRDDLSRTPPRVIDAEVVPALPPGITG